MINPEDTPQKRLIAANRLLVTISSCPSASRRGDFKSGDQPSYLSLDYRGRVWFFDSHTKRSVYTHYPYRWKHFSQGGTARSIVERLRDFIKGKGEQFKGTGYVRLYVEPYPVAERSAVLDVCKELAGWGEGGSRT